MSDIREREEALENAYLDAVETGEEIACPIAVSYNDYTKFKAGHPDAFARFGKFPGGYTSSGSASGSRWGQVRIRVPRMP